jgi:hypothetical protein
MANELAKTTQVPATVLTFSDVFLYPEFCLRGVADWNGVSRLGSKNIAALVKRARSYEHELTDKIATLKGRQALLRGKSGDDFKAMAEKFSNPAITEVGVRSGSMFGDPEPLDKASEERKGDTTTFNICGWCKHSSGGSARYNYMINTSCGLLANSPETHFNTPCLLQAKKAEQIAAEVRYIEPEIAGFLAKREKVREGIKLLRRLKMGAPEKPYLISLRPHDHFKVGDDVIVYTGQRKAEDNEHQSLVKDGVWVPANVVYGYRHQDGMVTYQALFPIHSNMSNLEGRGGFAGYSRPEVLLRSEFNYLQEAEQDDGDLGFVDMWLGNVNADRLEGFDRTQFQTDLHGGKIAMPPADWQPPTDEIEVKSVKDAESVLQMLSSSQFKTAEEIRSWANMQLRHVHPDRLNGCDKNVKSYAERQTRAVYAARDLLLARLGTR